MLPGSVVRHAKYVLSACRVPGHGCKSNKGMRCVAAEAASSTHAQNLSDVLFRGARVTAAAHAAWQQVVQEGDTVVDATCGRGRDTEILAALVQSTGTVHAFDIQQEAMDSTATRLESYYSKEPSRVMPDIKYHLLSHARIDDVVPPCSSSLVAFNLGYLPSADPSIITSAESTIPALCAAMKVLKPGGLISVLAYTGHDRGHELLAVRSKLGKLSTEQWITSETGMLNRPSSPKLIFCWKRLPRSGATPS